MSSNRKGSYKLLQYLLILNHEGMGFLTELLIFAPSPPSMLFNKYLWTQEEGGSDSNPRAAELATITKCNHLSWDLHDLREQLLYYSTNGVRTWV